MKTRKKAKAIELIMDEEVKHFKEEFEGHRINPRPTISVLGEEVI